MLRAETLPYAPQLMGQHVKSTSRVWRLATKPQSHSAAPVHGSKLTGGSKLRRGMHCALLLSFSCGDFWPQGFAGEALLRHQHSVEFCTAKAAAAEVRQCRRCQVVGEHVKSGDGRRAETGCPSASKGEHHTIAWFTPCLQLNGAGCRTKWRTWHMATCCCQIANGLRRSSKLHRCIVALSFCH